MNGTLTLPEHAAPLERLIARRLVRDCLKAGYRVSVNDGEETVVTASTERLVILRAMASTGEDYLILSQGGTRLGWVRLIYGNGVDLISDYSDNAAMRAIVDPIAEDYSD